MLIKMKHYLLGYFFLHFSVCLSAQHFSMTFDLIPESFEPGWGMAVSDEGNIYCVSAVVCQNLTAACANIYKFSNEGVLEWNTIIEDKKPINWENIQVVNDSIYIGFAKFTDSASDYCGGVVLDDYNGEELNSFVSSYPQGLSLAAFGQYIFNDDIYMFGSGSNINDPSEGPGYIHRMDKQGNYLDHLEYRVDNFNGIHQLQEGPNDKLNFLCFSTSNLTDRDDYSIVEYDQDSGETEVIYEIVNQRTSTVAPFYAILSDKYVITQRHFEENNNQSLLYSIKGVSFTGDSLWQVSDWRESWDNESYTMLEMTTCGNDDFLLSGQYSDFYGNDIGFIVRYDTNGELLWERRYYTYDGIGRVNDSYLSALREMPDGSIVAIGSMQKVAEVGAEEDFWILKVNADGCMDGEECQIEIFIDGETNYSFYGDLTNEINRWNEVSTSESGTVDNYMYAFSDYLVGGWAHVYKELLISEDQQGSEWETTGRLFRQFDSQIFEYTHSNITEYKIYDFSLELGDLFTLNHYLLPEDRRLRVTAIDSLSLEDGSKRKRLVLRDLEDPDGSIYGDQVWVEGIGNLNGLLAVFENYLADRETNLLCYEESNEVLYQNDDLGICWIPVSVETVDDKNNIRLFPNPTTGNLAIDLPDMVIGQLSVRDVTGQVVATQDLDYSEEVTLDLSENHTGMYVIEVVSESGERWVERVVVF